jgi:hypothetical protein
VAGSLRGKQDVGADATFARCGGQCLGVELAVGAGGGVVAAVVGAGVASVAVLHLHLGVLLAVQGVADEHAKAGLEGGDLSGLRGDVVHQDATVDLGAEVVVELVAMVLSVTITL